MSIIIWIARIAVQALLGYLLPRLLIALGVPLDDWIVDVSSELLDINVGAGDAVWVATAIAFAILGAVEAKWRLAKKLYDNIAILHETPTKPTQIKKISQPATHVSTSTEIPTPIDDVVLRQTQKFQAAYMRLQELEARAANLEGIEKSIIETRQRIEERINNSEFVRGNNTLWRSRWTNQIAIDIDSHRDTCRALQQFMKDTLDVEEDLSELPNLKNDRTAHEDLPILERLPEAGWKLEYRRLYDRHLNVMQKLQQFKNRYAREIQQQRQTMKETKPPEDSGN